MLDDTGVSVEHACHHVNLVLFYILSTSRYLQYCKNGKNLWLERHTLRKYWEYEVRTVSYVKKQSQKAPRTKYHTELISTLLYVCMYVCMYVRVVLINSTTTYVLHLQYVQYIRIVQKKREARTKGIYFFSHTTFFFIAFQTKFKLPFRTLFTFTLLGWVAVNRLELQSSPRSSH